MENNQQHNVERNTTQQEPSFSNSQPGQQLPQNNQSDKTTQETTNNEQHSESSLPQKENETLGTP